MRDPADGDDPSGRARTNPRGSGAQALRVGVDPLDRIHVVENHDEAYHVWREAGVRGRRLLHLDAHHDIWWMGTEGALTIGNYLWAALDDDLVREVVWVVPDPTWRTRATRRTAYQHLRDLIRRYPGSPRRIEVRPEGFHAQLQTTRLTVCPLAAVSPGDEAVLLDIDVDYLLIPQVAYWRDDVHAELPWCWPPTLVERLRDRGIRTDLVTLAYSVQGGYTPQAWKYLGDEIAERLASPTGTGDRAAAYARIGEGAAAEVAGDAAGAERAYREAVQRLPESAASCFRLAHLCAGQRRVAEARDWYRAAVERDPSYRNPYNTAALVLHEQRRHDAEDRVLRRMLDLDPEDPYAHYGLGRLAARHRRWRDAERHFERSLAGDDTVIDTYRALAGVMERLGREAEAVRAYERSLKLALEGGIPLAGPPAVNRERRLMDPAHWKVHARLARLYARRGETARAITGYGMSIAGQHDGVGVRFALARLHRRQHQWRRAGRETWGMLRQMPAWLWDEIRWRSRRVEGALRRLGEPASRTRYAPYSAERSPTWSSASRQVGKRAG